MDEKTDLNNTFENNQKTSDNENDNQEYNPYSDYSTQDSNMIYQNGNYNANSYNGNQNAGINYDAEQNQHYNDGNSNANVSYNQEYNSYDAYGPQDGNVIYQNGNYNANSYNGNQNAGMNYDAEQNQHYNDGNSNANVSYNQEYNRYDAYGPQDGNVIYQNGDSAASEYNYDNYSTQENFNYNSKKNGKKGIITFVGVIIAIIGYYVLTNYVFVNKLNISDYYTVSVDGISGDAKAKILSKKPSKAKRNLELKSFLDKANINFELSKSEGIQNGDTIQVDITYDTNLAKRNKIKVINNKFEIKVNDLPTNVKDISGIKNLSQIKESYENYFISELERKTDYYETLYEALGMYSGTDSQGKAVLIIYGKVKTRNVYYDGKASAYYYLELSDLMQNNNGEIIQATKASIDSDSYLNGELNPQELDSRLKLQGFSKIN